ISKMRTKLLHTLLFTICLAALASPFIGVRAAGGRVEGKVTDPKGAVVAGAAVTQTETNLTFTAVTDKQGQFKIEGVPAGVYTLTVAAQGFSEAQRADIKVE